MTDFCIFKFIEILLNFTNKLQSTPKKLILNYQKNEDKFTILLLFIYFLFIGTWSFDKASNQSFVFFQITFYIISIVAYYYSFLSLGNVIITYNLDYDFKLKIYDYEFKNDKIIEIEIPSPLLNKLRKRKETKEEVFKEKKMKRKVENVHFNFSNTISYHNLNEYNITNILINDSFNTVVSDMKKDKKQENSATNKKHNEDLNIQSNSEIIYKNRPIKIPGPGGDYYKYFALKYCLIQQFYPKERIDTRKYKSQEDFLDKIGKLENIKPGSLKNWYSRIMKEDFKMILKTYSRLIILLHENNELKMYPLADNCAKKLLSK